MAARRAHAVRDSNPTHSPLGSPSSPDNGPEMDLLELPLPCAISTFIAHGRMDSRLPEQRVQEAAMTDSARPICDCPEPCALEDYDC